MVFPRPGHGEGVGSGGGEQLGSDLGMSTILAEATADRIVSGGPVGCDGVVEHGPQHGGDNSSWGSQARFDLARIVEKGRSHDGSVGLGPELGGDGTTDTNRVTTIGVAHPVPHRLFARYELGSGPRFIDG